MWKWLRWKLNYLLLRRGLKVKVAKRASRVTDAYTPHPVGTPWWRYPEVEKADETPRTEETA